MKMNPMNETLAAQNDKYTATRFTVKDHTLVPNQTLNEAADKIYLALNEGKNVYVNCRGGVGRSAQVVIAYLIKYEGKTTDEAINHVQKRRPQISVKTSSQIVKKFPLLQNRDLSNMTLQEIKDVGYGNKKAKAAWKQVERYQNLSKIETRPSTFVQKAEKLGSKLSNIKILTK